MLPTVFETFSNKTSLWLSCSKMACSFFHYYLPSRKQLNCEDFKTKWQYDLSHDIGFSIQLAAVFEAGSNKNSLCSQRWRTMRVYETTFSWPKIVNCFTSMLQKHCTHEDFLTDVNSRYVMYCHRTLSFRSCWQRSLRHTLIKKYLHELLMLCQTDKPKKSSLNMNDMSIFTIITPLLGSSRHI